tara:strand:- start:930 stop:1079 length:150 start_codon:yes stop_codon:yes gene_type:complete
MRTIWKWFAIACAVWVLWYFGILSMLIHILGVLIVFLGGVIQTIGNILI